MKTGWLQLLEPAGASVRDRRRRRRRFWFPGRFPANPRAPASSGFWPPVQRPPTQRFAVGARERQGPSSRRGAGPLSEAVAGVVVADLGMGGDPRAIPWWRQGTTRPFFRRAVFVRPRCGPLRGLAPTYSSLRVLDVGRRASASTVAVVPELARLLVDTRSNRSTWRLSRAGEPEPDRASRYGDSDRPSPRLPSSMPKVADEHLAPRRPPRSR